MSLRAIAATVAVGVLLCAEVPAADSVEPPAYENCRLDAVFPAGGQQGQTVTVELLGVGDGLRGARAVLVDGAPGVTVREVKNVSEKLVQAVLEIAPDAPPGRRMLRVVSERNGITNFGYFVVGRLPEQLEQEKNNDPAAAQSVTLPVVVNGRVDPQVDVDCYRFQARAGQTIVAAVLAHAFDFHGTGRNDRGFVDATLEVLDAQGRVLADAGDTLGFDPVVELKIPADGEYVARVQLLGYGGFPEAVYRLTLGDVPLVSSVFPPGGQFGTTVDVEFAGPNVPAGTKQRVSVPTAPDLPLTHVSLDGATAGDHDLPFVFGPHPECLEAEPNDTRTAATPLSLPGTANGRFLEPGDEDWYRLTLKAKQPVFLEITAQRHLRSPVDTRIEVFNAEGTLRIANDDADEHAGVQPHDFKTFDSQLTFTSDRDGEFFVRISENTGASGHRAVYRLTASPAAPDFRLYVWPDAVPIWGPGTTAALLVKVERLHGFAGDVELTVDGLPPGWTGSTSDSLGNRPDRPINGYGLRVLLTITAPPDAPVGSVVPFQIVGRATQGDQSLQHTAQPLTFYLTGDRGLYRVSPKSRAVVAASRGPSLATTVRELEVKQGEAAKVTVNVQNAGDLSTLPIVGNLATNGVQCSLSPPANLPIQNGQIEVPLATEKLPAGTHGIIVSRAWRSDIRVGMPGPCTPVIRVHVRP